MKTNYVKKFALVALAGLATMGSANAATYAVGDLLMNFRSLTAPANVVEVNLGSGATYTANNTAVNQFVININAVLTSAFGSGWATDANLRSGIYGEDQADTLFVSKAQTTYSPGSDQSTNPVLASSTLYNGAINGVNGLSGAFAGYTSPAVTVFNGGLAIEAPSGLSNTYEEYVTGTAPGTASFGTTGLTPVTGEDTFNGGAGTFALDLYRMTARNVSSWEGTFHMEADGDVFFSSTQLVPEPGRAALVLLGAVGMMFRRRRNA